MAYQRRILLIALGTTPHLLTVTLAALYQKDPSAMPTEIHVITTQKGAECARREFIDKKDGMLAQFYADYGLPAAALEEKNIHVITGSDRTVLDDIRTPEDSAGAADFIVELVRELCSDPDSSLTVSIVGGRKSMSMLIGSAMTFFGRDQDTVSHVLSKTESPAGDWTYPTPAELQADPDVVNLGEIPFLRLRPILPEALLNRRYAYSDIVKASQEQLTNRVSATVTCVNDKWRLFIDSVEVKPEKRQLGIYLWLMLRQKLGRTTITSSNSVPIERFFLQHVQLVKVLERVQTEASWQSACKQYLGLPADRLKQLLKQAEGEELKDNLALWAWLQKAWTKEEKAAVLKATSDFSKKISICRTNFNEKLQTTLSVAIPDVTNRRLMRALIATTGDKEGATYSIGLLPADIALPRELTEVLDGVKDHPALHWKVV